MTKEEKESGTLGLIVGFVLGIACLGIITLKCLEHM